MYMQKTAETNATPSSSCFCHPNFSFSPPNSVTSTRQNTSFCKIAERYAKKRAWDLEIPIIFIIFADE